MSLSVHFCLSIFLGLQRRCCTVPVMFIMVDAASNGVYLGVVYSLNLIWCFDVQHGSLFHPLHSKYIPRCCFFLNPVTLHLFCVNCFKVLVMTNMLMPSLHRLAWFGKQQRQNNFLITSASWVPPSLAFFWGEARKKTISNQGTLFAVIIDLTRTL